MKYSTYFASTSNTYSKNDCCPSYYNLNDNHNNHFLKLKQFYLASCKYVVNFLGQRPREECKATAAVRNSVSGGGAGNYVTKLLKEFFDFTLGKV